MPQRVSQYKERKVTSDEKILQPLWFINMDPLLPSLLNECKESVVFSQSRWTPCLK